MTTRPTTPPVRWLVAATGLLTIACLATCAVPLILQNTIWAPKDPLTMLHRSTFSRMVNNAEQTAVLFAGGTRALVADKTFTFTQPDAWYYYTAWVGNRLYFVGASVRSLDLDQVP